MARIKGARDSKPRRKREFYAGKRIKPRRKKNGKMVLYEPKRKKSDLLKIWFWQKKSMSYEGYLRFGHRFRKYLHKFVYVFVGKPVFVEPSQISTPEAIEQTAIDFIQYGGVFYLMMPSHSKNSHRVSYKKKAIVRITDSEEGLNAKVSEYSNMRRYWFWRKQ